MKKLFLAIAAVAMVFATSCKKENINGAEEPVADNEFVCVVDQNANPQNAPRVDDGMGTMAHIDGSNNVWWQEGDVIAYYGKKTTNGVAETNAGRYELTCTKMAGDGRAYFSAQGTNFYQGAHEAYYPADIMHLNGEGQKELTLPNIINLEAGKNAGQLPMYGTGNGTHYITFHNICAVLKIAMPSGITTCNQIVLSATEPLCGPFTLDGTKAVLANEGTSTTLTVNAPSGTVFSGTVYVAIPENSTNGYTNFTVEFKDGSTSLFTKTNPNAMSVEAGKIYPVTISTVTIPEDCFHFTALSTNTDTVSIQLNQEGNVPPYSMEYFKTGSSEWTTYTIGQPIPLAAGEKVYFRNSASDDSEHPITSDYANYSYFSTTGNGYVDVSGNIMYLLNGTNPPTCFVSIRVFEKLFYEMTGLKNAQNLILPATTLTEYCYECMFSDCTALITAPALNATTLAEGCCTAMFFCCSSLTTAPELKATTMADLCYNIMFAHCTSLKTSPTLPATTLEELCYAGMFAGCTSLSTAPELNATTLKDSCYMGMFTYCSSLTAAPTLHATTLEEFCYAGMFAGCTSLTDVTMLATDVSAEDCLTDWLTDAGTSATNPSVTINSTLSNTPGTPGATITSNTPTDWTISNGSSTTWPGTYTPPASQTKRKLNTSLRFKTSR